MKAYQEVALIAIGSGWLGVGLWQRGYYFFAPLLFCGVMLSLMSISMWLNLRAARRTRGRK